MAELQFRDIAAAGYDRSVGEMTRRIVPSLQTPPSRRSGDPQAEACLGIGGGRDGVHKVRFGRHQAV